MICNVLLGLYEYEFQGMIHEGGIDLDPSYQRGNVLPSNRVQSKVFKLTEISRCCLA